MLLFITLVLLFAVIMMSAFHEKNNDLPNYLRVN